MMFFFDRYISCGFRQAAPAHTKPMETARFDFMDGGS